MTQDVSYFEAGYIEASYFTRVVEAECAITASFTTTALGDKLQPSYFIAGYIDPDYFEQAPLGVVKEFDSIISCSFVETVQASRTVTTTVAISATFVVTANNYAQRFIELHAFNNAALTAQAKRIRNVNIAVSSVFTVAASVTKSVYVLSREDSVFTMSANNRRVRFSQAATSAAFSFATDALEIVSPGTRTKAVLVGDLNG